MNPQLTLTLTESGNMLIMTLSYTQKTGDLSLISTYVSLGYSPYAAVV